MPGRPHPPGAGSGSTNIPYGLDRTGHRGRQRAGVIAESGAELLGSRRPVLRSCGAYPEWFPDVTALMRLTCRDGIRGIIATAPAADPGSGYDFVSSFFAPAAGIPEDPVTGSAHTALVPYWSQRLGRDNLVGLQASARTGLVRTTMCGDRVRLTGHAVTVLDGTMRHIPG